MNTEANQTRAKVAERQAQVEFLEAKVREERAVFEAESQEKVAHLRPIMDFFQSQILSIQRQMADEWNKFPAERQKVEAAVMGRVTDIEMQIHVLNQANSKAASFFAPIRRLPVELFTEIFILSISCHARPRLELMRVCRSWRAVVLMMPHI
jgi:hypothetical protein